MSAATADAAKRLRAVVRPATMSDVDRVLPRVREADRRELWSGWRHTPEESLRHGLSHSSHVWTGLIDFEPACIFGVVPGSLLSGVGVPWLIGTDAIEAHALLFLRRSRPQVARMRLRYAHLINHVAADNVKAVSWLEWLGFTMQPAQPFGPDRALFRRFEWRHQDV